MSALRETLERALDSTDHCVFRVEWDHLGLGDSLGGRMRPSMHKALDFLPRDTHTVSDGTSL